MKKIFGMIIAFVCLLTGITMFAPKVQAMQSLDLTKDVTLTVDYKHDTQVLSDATFKLYKIADTDENTNLTKVKDFEAYPITFTNLNNDEWNDVALTLVGYIKRDNIAPINEGKTDSTGKLTFTTTSSNDKLTAGLYLLEGSSIKIDKNTYKAKPTMVFLPTSDDGKNTWIYDVVMAPKSERIADPKLTSCKVIKIWEDDNNKDSRPKEISVDLLKDGKVVDTVKLNENNSWRYSWDKLAEESDWAIAEKEVSNYTVNVSKEGNTFTLTNKWQSKVPPATPSKPPQVPYTGLLWWPVPILAAGGGILVVIALIRKKSN